MIDARAIEAAAMKRAIKAARSMMRPFVPPNNETLAKALTAAAPFLTQIPDGWKTIDTAPPCDLVKVKPTYALLYIPGIGVRSGEVGNYLGKLFGTVPTLHGNAVDDWGATHWMPLPLPPPTEKNDG